MMISRRVFLSACATLGAGRAADRPARLGIVCQLGAGESGVRQALAQARAAGFEQAQLTIPWDRVEEPYLKALPGWVAAEGIRVAALSAYVNCVSPAAVLMNTREEHFDRAIGLATELGTRRLVAWTGGYNDRLLVADPRNFEPAACDAICRFLEPRLPRLEASGLTLALEQYITLACPDALSLRRLLDRLPPCLAAVLDPPNLTPIARYGERDAVLREMVRVLKDRIGIVHMKDFRLAKDGKSYDLPGPLGGVMNYPLFAELLKDLPPDVPFLAEHLAPAEFAAARTALTKLLP